MRQCPQCERNYTDESLNFCLEDGSPLVAAPGKGEPITDVLPVMPSEATTRVQGLRSPSGRADEIRSRAPTSSPASTRRNPGFAAVGGVIVLSLLAAAGYYWIYRPSTVRQINSVAVMPFANESGSADAEYLSDGITDSLINGLSKIQGLNVKARATVFRYKGKMIEPAVIRQELAVDAILNGRVIQRGDDLSIYLSLVDTSTGDQIWGDGYERKLADIVSLQKEITRDVSQKLQVRLSRTDEQRVAKSYTNDPEAYRLYLRGRHHVLKATQPEVETSIKYFQQAIQRDPTYALAYVGLADAYRSPATERQPAEALARSKAAIQKALEIDDTLADAHAVLGFIIFWYEWDWPAAESEFKRAIDLDPKNADAHNFFAHLLSNTGRHEEALSEARLSRELDPLNLRVNALEGQFLIHAGRVDEGLARLAATLELDPNNWMAHLFSTSGYIEKGVFDTAIQQGRKAIEMNPNSRSFSFFGYALAKAGRKAQAREELDALFAASKDRWVSSYNIALIYNGLDEHDQTLSWLEKGVTDRDPRMVFLKVEPKWNNLRSNARFQKVMAAVGF